MEVISLVAEKLNSVSSTSVATSGTITDPFSLTLIISSKLPMIGASFTGVTVKSKVDASVKLSPSVTVTVTERSQKKSASGDNTTLEPSVDISAITFSTAATGKV